MKKQLTVVKKIPWKSRKSCWLTYHCIGRVCSYFVIFPCIKFDVTPLTPILCPWQWNRPFSVFELVSEILVQEMFKNIYYSFWKFLPLIFKKTNIFTNKSLIWENLGLYTDYGYLPNEDFSTISHTFAD